MLKDVSFRALPMSRVDALEMIEDIRLKKILDGVRGAAPVDKAALVELIMKVAAVSQSHPEIAEIDLNPVIARSDGYPAVCSPRSLLRQKHQGVLALSRKPSCRPGTRITFANVSHPVARPPKHKICRRPVRHVIKRFRGKPYVT